MAFKDLRDTLDGSIKLPVNGKTYTIAPVSAEVGLRMQDMMNVASGIAQAQKDGTKYTPSAKDEEFLSDSEEADLYADALGDAYNELLEDGATFAELKMCALTVIFHATQGEEFAEAYWNAGGKAPAPNRAERRTATRTRTDGAITTKRRASQTGTTTQKGTTQTIR